MSIDIWWTLGLLQMHMLLVCFAHLLGGHHQQQVSAISSFVVKSWLESYSDLTALNNKGGVMKTRLERLAECSCWDKLQSPRTLGRNRIG